MARCMFTFVELPTGSGPAEFLSLKSVYRDCILFDMMFAYDERTSDPQWGHMLVTSRRGLPSDVSLRVREEYDDYFDLKDGRAASWLSYPELETVLQMFEAVQDWESPGYDDLKRIVSLMSEVVEAGQGSPRLVFWQED